MFTKDQSLKKKKHSRLNGIQAHDLCNTGTVLEQLTYQTTWEQVIFRVCNITTINFTTA